MSDLYGAPLAPVLRRTLPRRRRTVVLRERRRRRTNPCAVLRSRSLHEPNNRRIVDRRRPRQRTELALRHPAQRRHQGRHPVPRDDQLHQLVLLRQDERPRRCGLRSKRWPRRAVLHRRLLVQRAARNVDESRLARAKCRRTTSRAPRRTVRRSLPIPLNLRDSTPQQPGDLQAAVHEVAWQQRAVQGVRLHLLLELPPERTPVDLRRLQRLL